MRFRTELGQSLDLGLLTLGREAGKEVKRNRVVAGEEVSTLSDSKVVSSNVVAEVAVVHVLCHFGVGFIVGPTPRVGVSACGEDSQEVPPNVLSERSWSSSLLLVVGPVADSE